MLLSHTRTDQALHLIEEELGAPLHELYDGFLPEPTAAASLGQVRLPDSQGRLEMFPLLTRRDFGTSWHHASVRPLETVVQQVYKARIKATGTTVAVKVQRPRVLQVPRRKTLMGFAPSIVRSPMSKIFRCG
jgi:hypothetical protein